MAHRKSETIVRPHEKAAAKPVLRYLFGPFLIESELVLSALSGMEQRAGDDGIPVAVRLGRVDPEPPMEMVQVTPFVWAGSEGCLLVVPGTGRFSVRGGHEIVADLEAEAPAADVQSYVLGWCLGAICYGNGMLPLHACGVDYGGGVAAFLGDSGAGKSTLAACLQREGYRLIADDICLLAPGPGGMETRPLVGWIKLWETSLQYLGQVGEERNRTFADDAKFRVPVDLRGGGVAPPLRRMVVLQRGEALRLTRLSAVEALGAMLDNLYLGYCTEAMGIRPRVFAQCAEALAGAEVYRLEVPWGLEFLEETVGFLRERVLR